MKILKYNICTIVEGSEVLSAVEMGWSESNEEIAKAESYNGEYTIEDDGEEEISEPTQLDRVEAQLAYTAMMTDTLLEV